MNKGKIQSWAWIPAILFLVFIMYKMPEHLNSLPQPDYPTSKFENLTEGENQTSEYFKDVTLISGIYQPHIQRSEYLSGIHESLGAGACAFDYDNDGWLDLLTLNGSGATHFYGKPQWWQKNNNSLTLYRNNQDGSFTDITQLSQLTHNSWTMGCAGADFDNDGDIDIFISNYGENQLWRNHANGTYSNATLKAGINGKEWSTSISIADINNDGLLDIYVNNYIDFKTNSLTFENDSGFESSLPENFNVQLYSGQANQLWINRGNLQFVESAKFFGVDNAQGRSLASRWLDIDDNGYPDLIVANDTGSENKTYLNIGGKRFVDISTDSRLAFADKATDINATDFNNDGNSEVFITTDNTLFPKVFTGSFQINSNKNYGFNDVSDRYRLSSSTTISQSHWGSVASDFNHDGWIDLFIANGIHTPDKDALSLPRGQTNNLLINHRGKYFSDQNESVAPGTYSWRFFNRKQNL